MNGICFNYRGLCMPQQPPICQFFALKPAPCMEMLASHRLLLNNRFCEYFTGVILTLYILVMECFWGVYCEYPRSHLYTKKTKVTSGIFHGYAMRKGCITILYHAIENTVTRWEGWVWYSWIAQSDQWKGLVEYWRIYNSFPAFWLAVFSMAWCKTQ